MRVFTASLALFLTACRIPQPPLETPPPDADGDGFAADVDCDDADPAVFPDAPELCNELDDDCNSFVDDRPVDSTESFADADGDGHGDPDARTLGCSTPPGQVSSSDDCDDTNPNRHPDAIELPYNGVDDDCDSTTLDDDLDQDGVLGAEDCDDEDPARSPLLDEVYYNGVDDDCDPHTIDDDQDGDGSPVPDDCDDTNLLVSPNVVELPYNGVDDDCDSTTLDDDLDQDGAILADDCDDSDPARSPLLDEVYYNAIDDDCDPNTVDDDQDGDGSPVPDDCDDTNPLANPSAVEVTYNGVDDDCDPATLDDDLDQDGAALADDCDDADPTRSALFDEVYYNAIDDDCDPNTVDDDQDHDGRTAYPVGGDDCNDLDPSVSDCGSDPSAALPTCLDILNIRPNAIDDAYWVDPDGAGAVNLRCDMTTEGGGWTEVPYAADLTYQRQFTGGDGRKWLPSDFSLALPDATINALRARSTEGRQTYVGLCNGVLHYFYTAGLNWDYALAFRFHTGAESAFGQSYTPWDVTVTQDGCAGNGGEGGLETTATVFELRSVELPLINVQTRDNGNNNELFGSPLTQHSAWLR